VTIAVDKIVLKIGRKTVELSVEEAIELREALGAVVGKDRIKEIHHHDWYWRRGYDNWPLQYWNCSTAGGPTTSTTATFLLSNDTKSEALSG
jgi:hypothetical protein